MRVKSDGSADDCLEPTPLLEAVVAAESTRAASRGVEANKAAPGVGGTAADAPRAHLREH